MYEDGHIYISIERRMSDLSYVTQQETQPLEYTVAHTLEYIGAHTLDHTATYPLGDTGGECATDFKSCT